MGSSPPPAPAPVDPGKASLDYIRGITDPELQNKIISSEREYRPQYQDLNLQDAMGYLTGSDAQRGLLDMQDLAGRRNEDLRAELSTAQRTADIGDVEALGGRATEALRNSDPLMAKLLGQQTGMSDLLYQRAQGLNPQQKRQADQQAREAFGARGRLNDNAGVAAEILNREDYMRQNRAEAQQSGGQTFGMLQSTSADPFQAILGRPASSVGTGMATAGMAQGAIGASQPGLFNADAGINLALQNNSNQSNYQSNVYGAQQARTGAIIGGLFQGAGAAAAGKSDRRLKTNIVRLGTHPVGVGLYSYTMKATGKKDMGVMAQELQEVMPDAVHEHPSGYLMVDYSKL